MKVILTCSCGEVKTVKVPKNQTKTNPVYCICGKCLLK